MAHWLTMMGLGIYIIDNQRQTRPDGSMIVTSRIRKTLINNQLCNSDGSLQGKDGVGIKRTVVDVVGREDDGGSGLVSYALKGLKDHYPVLHVKKCCGLVKHEDVRPAG